MIFKDVPPFVAFTWPNLYLVHLYLLTFSECSVWGDKITMLKSSSSSCSCIFTFT